MLISPSLLASLKVRAAFTSLVMNRDSITPSPIIQIKMTDEDVIWWIANMWGKQCQGPHATPQGYKPIYQTRVSGSLAVQWMLTVYPFMGLRRRRKIAEIIRIWRSGDTIRPRALSASDLNKAKISCSLGHPYDARNSRGQRECLQCRRARKRRRWWIRRTAHALLVAI